MKDIKFIALDADDTLWQNEINYRKIEDDLDRLLAEYTGDRKASEILLETEKRNVEIYGFGAKSFLLSIIETIIQIVGEDDCGSYVNQVLDWGKELINKPTELMDGVEDTIKELRNRDYTLILATKGDLLDQNRKLEKSNLRKYFDYIEIMSDKKAKDYCDIIDKLNCRPEELLMVGNSLKSDILPPLEIGAKAAYIPSAISWAHESVDDSVIDKNRFISLKCFSQLLDILN
jgi:putative hydrolase of the HAD superfamily